MLGLSDFGEAIRLSNNLVLPAHMQMISLGGMVHITMIKFHFVVVFLSALADDALTFGLIIHRLDQLIFVPILNFNQINRPKISCRATTRPLHLQLFSLSI